MTLDDFAEYCWSFIPVTKKTVENYQGAYKRNISPKLGQGEISEITKREFLDVLAPLAAPNYFQTLMATRVIYREALNREIVKESPVALIKGPKSRPKPQKFLTWEEVSETNFGKYDEQIKFLALHGLRWGEAVALIESDIVKEKIFVNKSIHGATKTKAGIRVIPQIQPFKEFPTSPKGIRRVLHSHGIHIHSLRHTYAYLLKSSGVHVTTAQRLMGHSDPKITLGIYTQFRDEEIDAAASLIRKFGRQGHYYQHESELLLF